MIERQLAVEADVLIENFKVGSLARFGLDYASLAAINPRLVYASITGFGQTGPYAEFPGYDYLLQGMSGLMSITGEPDGDPQRSGVAVTDLVSGLFTVIGILAALRKRDETGTGEHIDVALFDCAASMLVNQAISFLATDEVPERTGNTHPNIVPYQVFPVVDGKIIIAAGNDGQYRRLCGVLGCPELGSDPGFATNADRVRGRDDLVPLLVERTKKLQLDDLLYDLRAADVPAGPINTIDMVFQDPQIAARGMRIEPEGIGGLKTPLRFSDSELVLARTAPSLDRYGDIIRSLGFAALGGNNLPDQ